MGPSVRTVTPLGCWAQFVPDQYPGGGLVSSRGGNLKAPLPRSSLPHVNHLSCVPGTPVSALALSEHHSLVYPFFLQVIFQDSFLHTFWCDFLRKSVRVGNVRCGVAAIYAWVPLNFKPLNLYTTPVSTCGAGHGETRGMCNKHRLELFPSGTLELNISLLRHEQILQMLWKMVWV